MSKKFSDASEYPLAWPESFERTKRPESSRFNTSLFQALENVKDSLRKFATDSGHKVEHVLISSNYSLTNCNPKDAGVSVYFTWDSEQTCIPVDRYKKVQENLQAIHHCIEAERVKLRHGGINLVKAAFRGYAALPSPDSATRSNWREILNYQGTDLQEANEQYRKARSKAHPDKGGSAELAHAVSKAWEQAQHDLCN